MTNFAEFEMEGQSLRSSGQHLLRLCQTQGNQVQALVAQEVQFGSQRFLLQAEEAVVLLKDDHCPPGHSNHFRDLHLT